MHRTLKRLAPFVAIVVAMALALYLYRTAMMSEGMTPEGFRLLTAMPGSGGFEPKALPKAPVIANRGSSDLAIAFGYKVGSIPYSYTLQLTFPAKGDTGHAVVTVRQAASNAKTESDVVRRWDEPRQAYAVALQEKFDIEPPVPSLCIKAVIGPQPGRFDLHDGSLCVAQRDATGTCRPETLACGLLR